MFNFHIMISSFAVLSLMVSMVGILVKDMIRLIERREYHDLDRHDWHTHQPSSGRTITTTQLSNVMKN